MAWSNPIIGGGNTLIREEIKSPDYVPGVSGWSIKKDGTAEFNDVTIRGELFVTDPDGSYVRIYDENPGSGALIEFGLPTASGSVLTPGSITSTDSVPGVGEPGLIFESATVDGTPSGRIELISNTTSNISEITIDATDLRITNDAYLELGGGDQISVKFSGTGGALDVQGVDTNTTFEGNVVVEGSFSRPGCIVSFGTPNITSGVVAQTITLSAIQNTYGMFAGGTPTIVTIPRDGSYEVGMLLRYGSQNPNANLRQMKYLINGVEAMQWNFPAVTNMNGTNITLNGIDHVMLQAGDTITFQTLQNSGVTLGIVAGSKGWVRLVED